MEQPTTRSGRQSVKNVFRISAAGDALCSLANQQAQEALAALVDKGDFIKVEDACAALIPFVIVFPARPELTNPWSDKTTLQDPSLFRSRFSEIDL